MRLYIPIRVYRQINNSVFWSPHSNYCSGTTCVNVWAPQGPYIFTENDISWKYITYLSILYLTTECK